MKQSCRRAATLLFAALACLAPPSLRARAQDDSRWVERPGPVKNEVLRRELLQMLKEDQAVRAPFLEGRQPTEAEMRAMSERDAADTKRMSDILDKYGFPGVKLVGLNATRAFVTMLLHSPSLELQKRALPHVERAVSRKEIPPDDFALLTDDVLMGEGKPQLFGTNFKFVGDKVALDTTQDLAHLDERRRKIGLPPIRVYAQQLAELYKKSVDESSLPAPVRPQDSGDVELIFTGSILREAAREILIAPESPNASLPKKNLAAGLGGRFRAFTAFDEKHTHGFADRIFFEDVRAGRTFEIRNLQNPHRPFDDLKFFGGVLQFDRWAGPHTGIRYRVDVRHRRLVSARAFVESDYVRLLKKSQAPRPR